MDAIGDYEEEQRPRILRFVHGLLRMLARNAGVTMSDDVATLARTAEGAVTGSATEEIPGPEPAPSKHVKGLVTDAWERFAQTGSLDQFRGRANEAIGETKLNIGLALNSPEMALLGLAQKALGHAQRYVGEAKLAADPDSENNASRTGARDSLALQKTPAQDNNWRMGEDAGS